MEKDDAFIAELEGLYDKYNYTIEDLLRISTKKDVPILNLGEDAYREFAALYRHLEQLMPNPKEKGDALEKLITCLFVKGYGYLFEVAHNCRTSTNEIDILLLWTDYARCQGIMNSFSFLGNSVLCECKNYKGSVDVTYVGKFASLMRATRHKTGIMFAWDGVSGRGGWDSAKGLIKKIVLRDNDYIIVIDKNDLKKIYDKGTSILSILYHKYVALQNETSYDKYILPHESEGMFKEHITHSRA